MQEKDSAASTALVSAALRQFAAAGFDGASLQRIADDAGLSKSSVLYHFGSKEALLDAALRPAVKDLRDLMPGLVTVHDEGADLPAFATRFVEYLVRHRLAIAVLINHGQGLAGHAVIDEADALLRELGACLAPDGAAEDDATRFGVALAGAAFMLVAADRWSLDPMPESVLLASLTRVVAELLTGAPHPASQLA